MKSTDLNCAAAERRIRPYVIETPVARSAWLSASSGAEVYLKLENLQETGAFKPRGRLRGDHARVVGKVLGGPGRRRVGSNESGRKREPRDEAKNCPHESTFC